MVKAFMKWYGEPLDDVKVKIPKSLPAYTEDSDIEKLFEAIKNKRSHKGCPSVPFQVMVFESQPPEDCSDWEQEDCNNDYYNTLYYHSRISDIAISLEHKIDTDQESYLDQLINGQVPPKSVKPIIAKTGVNNADDIVLVWCF
jgi:hypothetical protein